MARPRPLPRRGEVLRLARLPHRHARHGRPRRARGARRLPGGRRGAGRAPPHRAHRDAAAAGPAAVRRRGRRRLDAGAAHGLALTRPQRQLVAPAGRRRALRPGVPDPLPARVGRGDRARLGLAGRALRPAHRPRLRAAAPAAGRDRSRALRRPGARRARRAGGLHDGGGVRGLGRGPARPHPSRVLRGPHGPGRGPGGLRARRPAGAARGDDRRGRRDRVPRVTVPVFDGHNDALTREPYHSLAGRRPDGHVDLPRMAAGGMRGGIFAVFAPSERQTDGFGEPVERTDGVVEFVLAPEVEQPAAAGYAVRAAGRLLALERAGALRVARSAADLDAAHAGGPPAAVLHLEGAEAIDPGLEALETWHAAGLRSLGLVWSRPNRFGNGVPFRFPSSPDTGPGLTDAGKALVKGCNELKIMIDLSHLNEKGFRDVADISDAPLVATHSNVHAISGHSRNLTDWQLGAIRESGGMVGLNFATGFLREDGRMNADTGLDIMVRHVDSLLQ